MLGTYTYHEIIKKTVVAFGTLFNNIEIRKKDGSNNIESIRIVPLAYSGRQKFLARLEQNPELNKKFENGIPRMSFEMTGISYDSTRKTGIIEVYKKSSSGSQVVKTQYLPVPYNLDFELYIFSKVNEDSLQILEQILPYFQPSFNLTVNTIPEMEEKKDIPIVLNNISMTDEYEGDFETRRAITYTLSFTVKTYIYGPVNADNSTLIKNVQVQTFAGSGVTYGRVRKYTVEPDPITAGPEDDFGFSISIEEP